MKSKAKGRVQYSLDIFNPKTHLPIEKLKISRENLDLANYGPWYAAHDGEVYALTSFAGSQVIIHLDHLLMSRAHDAYLTTVGVELCDCHEPKAQDQEVPS